MGLKIKIIIKKPLFLVNFYIVRQFFLICYTLGPSMTIFLNFSLLNAAKVRLPGTSNRTG